MKSQAKVVIVGGGILGVSLLYHLTKEGWTDIALVEKVEHHEVLNLAERVTVLRDGKVVVAGELVETLDNEKLVREIVGAELKQIKSIRPLDLTTPTHQRLEVENLVGLNLRGVSFKISTGEILGIAGVIGSGRDELAGTVFGASPRFSGKVLVDKNKVFSSKLTQLLRMVFFQTIVFFLP